MQTAFRLTARDAKRKKRYVLKMSRKTQLKEGVRAFLAAFGYYCALQEQIREQYKRDADHQQHIGLSGFGGVFCALIECQHTDKAHYIEGCRYDGVRHELVA